MFTISDQKNEAAALLELVAADRQFLDSVLPGPREPRHSEMAVEEIPAEGDPFAVSDGLDRKDILVEHARREALEKIAWAKAAADGQALHRIWASIKEAKKEIGAAIITSAITQAWDAAWEPVKVRAHDIADGFRKEIVRAKDVAMLDEIAGAARLAGALIGFDVFALIKRDIEAADLRLWRAARQADKQIAQMGRQVETIISKYQNSRVAFHGRHARLGELSRTEQAAFAGQVISFTRQIRACWEKEKLVVIKGKKNRPMVISARQLRAEMTLIGLDHLAEKLTAKVRTKAPRPAHRPMAMPKRVAA